MIYIYTPKPTLTYKPTLCTTIIHVGVSNVWQMYKNVGFGYAWTFWFCVQGLNLLAILLKLSMLWAIAPQDVGKWTCLSPPKAWSRNFFHGHPPLYIMKCTPLERYLIVSSHRGHIVPCNTSTSHDNLSQYHQITHQNWWYSRLCSNIQPIQHLIQYVENRMYF